VYTQNRTIGFDESWDADALAGIVQVSFYSGLKRASFDKNYTDSAQCQQFECAKTCKDCASEWDNFVTVYKSQEQCEANECGDCSMCVDKYDNLDYFVTGYSSTEQCQAAECNFCSDCLHNAGSKEHFSMPVSTIDQCFDRYCHDCSKCASSWDTEFVPMWGMNKFKLYFLEWRDLFQDNDLTARYLSQEECEYYECSDINKCFNYYDEPAFFGGVEFDSETAC